MLRVIANVYVDGRNLFYGCLKGSPYKWLDLVALSKALLPHDEIKTVRYFTARVTSNPRHPHRDTRQDQYLRALATLPEVAIHLGYFRRDRVRMPVANPPPNTIEVIKTEEKGSDVNLGAHLMRDAYLQHCKNNSSSPMTATLPSQFIWYGRTSGCQSGSSTRTRDGGGPRSSAETSTGQSDRASWLQASSRRCSKTQQGRSPSQRNGKQTARHKAGRETPRPKPWGGSRFLMLATNGSCCQDLVIHALRGGL
jgi:hypothetical protein